jgi:hypothetical protein
MKRSEWISVCGVALALFLASPARADMMTYNGVGLNAIVQIHAPGHLADGMTVYAGQYLVSFEGANYAAWCVDIDQYSGNMPATEESYTVLRNSSAVAYLYDTYANSLGGGTDAAALGASIWEVITEPQGGPFNINSGSFSISENAAVASRAAAMLASIPGSYEPQEDLVVLHSDTMQDMLIGIPTGSPAPEPLTLALLIGGAALGLVRRLGRRMV